MKTKEKILLGAKTYLLEHGQGSFTVRSIAKQAGVNPGLVHHYFGSKENLVLELIETESNNALQQIKKSVDKTSTQDDFENVRESIIENFLSNTVVMKLIIEAIILSDNSPALKAKMREIAISRRKIITGLLGIKDPIGEIIFQSGLLGVILLKKLDESVDLQVILKQLYELTKNMSNSKRSQ